MRTILALIAVCAFEGLGLYALTQRHKADLAALSAKPKTETKIETRTNTVTVQGPERIIERVIKGEVVERIVYKEPETTTTVANQELEKSVAPACTAAPSRWRYAGVMVNPTSQNKLVGLRAGVTLWNRLDLGAGVRFGPRTEGLAEAGIRF